MTDGLKNLESMVEGLLATKNLPSPEQIREIIASARGSELCEGVTDIQAERLACEFEERHGVSMNIGSVLKEDEDYEPWLDSTRAEIKPYYWDRYRKLLAKKRFSGQVLSTLDNVTDRTLGLLQNPGRSGKWDRRGMVVGHVQSGKTANYTGLICKAADAGYKLIVVIAGIHNNLRNQTQSRIDEGFIGWDSARLLMNKGENQSIIGVGLFGGTRKPVTFTNSIRDFSKTMATGVGVSLENLKDPAVFVIKKNTNTLKNILEWLREHNASRGTSSISEPMLLIDDEADNASINIKRGMGEVSRINGQIRDLLNLFDRSCYIGYTATPFANIFIDPKTDDEMYKADLFPRDFIVSLDPPSNYFGASRVFIDGSDSAIRHIDDNEDLLPIKHQINHKIIDLPESLKRAVRTFIVAKAIRLMRGQSNEHCSMLVNVSRFTNIQSQIRNEIHDFVGRIGSSARVHGAMTDGSALDDPEIAALHDLWASEFKDVCEFKWDDLQQKLLESVAPINVVEVNSKASGALSYAEHEKTGWNVIAVGGFSLSRGLTLEGLMVSYFLRNSMMYDTLMQMGRWFGYRPGYDDLCRIWMPEEAEGWYSHIAESIEELRDELRRMEAANATPIQFGLKVRSHPDTLIVTARNKMGSGEKLTVSVGLANKFVETAILKRDDKSLELNRKAAVSFAKSLKSEGCSPDHGHEGGGSLVRDVPVEPILRFLERFQNHQGSFLTETGPIRQYIEDRSDNELAKWDVLFAGLKSADRTGKGLVDDSLGFEINCQRRAPGKLSDADTLRVTNKQRVSSRGVEKTGLTNAQIEEAESEYRNENNVTGQSTNYPDRIYRNVRQRPLLIIHLLAIGDDIDDLSKSEPIVAWSISFPATDMEEKKVEYVVNTTWLNENYGEDLDEDEMAGDDDQ